MTRFLQKVG
ncbi:rCG33038, partial [Rattus norvegicus]